MSPAAASFASVGGASTLGGATVGAVFANGSYVSKRYTLLTASGGVSGTFGALVTNGLSGNTSVGLSYDANDVYLDLTLNFGIPSGLNGNQQRVGDALTNVFNTNGGIAAVYAALSPGGLTQASGESGTGSQQATFNAMGQFVSLLTDPAANGGPGSASGAAGFAEDDQASAYAARKRIDAFAMMTKAPAQTFAQRWSVWAAGFGGSQTTAGNAIAGSNDATSRVFGTAVGADYRVSADTLAGFALAGGGTNFSVANGLGSGRSDLFQAGAYLRHNHGPAYLSAALAYGWQDITTDRTVTIAGIDRLRAEFNANAYSGRLEGGSRFIAPWMGGIGLTPYGAAQVTTFDLPAYAERAVSGTGAFALNYAARRVTDTRSELGLRSDKAFAMNDSVLTLRGRLAWAHDLNPDRTAAATFQALPGASFIVSGAAQARDSALTTAAAEMKWMNGWSVAATFEGEFSNVTRSYAGKGSVRYAW
nr:autotransporter outer membrane beta-barrel domain-containing protein [Bradyrhizobium diazoefficiens]